MNKEEIRREKTRLSRKCKQICKKEGKRWRDLHRAEKPVRARFLKLWQDYLEGKNSDEFLRISKNYGYLLELQDKEHVKIVKLVMPFQRRYSELGKLQKTLNN